MNRAAEDALEGAATRTHIASRLDVALRSSERLVPAER